MRSLIGITGRQMAYGLVANTSPRFRNQLVNTYFNDFAERVAEAGGVPVHLPFASVDAGVIGRLDGLIVTGGQDVHPERWGGSAAVDTTLDPRWAVDVHDAGRDSYEAALIEEALEAQVPLLGVCRGHQLLNVVLGGTLVEHIEYGPIVHSTEHCAPSSGDDNHVVTFTEGSWAHALYGPRRIVNSWHHQAVDRAGSGISVVGRTGDDIVECIEVDGLAAVGVQWHPEWEPDADPVFEWLVDRSTASHSKR